MHLGGSGDLGFFSCLRTQLLWAGLGATELDIASIHLCNRSAEMEGVLNHSSHILLLQ